jgi:hypothetical protein
MDDIAAAILLKIAVEQNEQLKAEVKRVDLTTNPKGLEDLLVPWWRSFKSQK